MIVYIKETVLVKNRPLSRWIGRAWNFNPSHQKHIFI